RPDAVAAREVLHHIELHRQLCHFAPVDVGARSLQRIERSDIGLDGFLPRLREDHMHEPASCGFGLAWTRLHDPLYLHLAYLWIGHLLSVRLLRDPTRCDRHGEPKNKRDTTGDHKTIPVRVV